MPSLLAASIVAALSLCAQDQRPALPLVITRTWIETAGQPPGTGLARVEVLNTGQRTILAWGVRYLLKPPNGQAVPSSGYGTDAASVPPEDRTISVVAPGQTVHNSPGGAIVPADSLFSYAAVTYVIFDDDSALGDERWIAIQFARRRERQVFWQKMQAILDDAAAHETESSAVLAQIRQGMETETDPKFREGAYYNEILARMSARRMELTHMTPDGVLKNLRTLISTQKANADAHSNRR